MKKIEITKISKQDTATMVQLDKNYAIAAVKVLLSSAEDGKLSIKVAQNGILSDLIPFSCEKELDREHKIEFAVETPVSASHIFIFSSNEDIEINEISVFEREENLEAECYPACFDTDLSENYYLDTVSVFTPAEGYSHYSIYTSINGRAFDFLARKNDGECCDTILGDVYNAMGREARIIRVYIEYNSASTEVVLNDVKFTGRKSGTLVQNRPELNIPDFENSEYNIMVTEENAYEKVYDILERRMGKKYWEWFTLALAEKHNCIFVDFQKIYEDYCKIRHSAYIAWDRVHPNQKGATLMARAFLEKVGFNYLHNAEK